MGFGGLPPAPTSILMLEAVETVETSLNFRIKIGLVQRLEIEFRHRLLNHNVGEETGHSLFDAAVGKSSQIVERTKDRARYGRRKSYGQRA